MVLIIQKCLNLLAHSRIKPGYTICRRCLKMDANNIDLGAMKSRDLGNMVSKALVEIGKEVVKSASPNGYVDYGNLPSRALPELGKQAVANVLGNESTQ